jgi:hypothetical protein
MTNHVRMGIYSITQGTYEALLEKAREGLAPILRNSPGFVFYSVSNPRRRAARIRQHLGDARAGRGGRCQERGVGQREHG